MKIITTFSFFLLSTWGFSQTFPINIPGYLELNDMVIVNDKIYGVGGNSGYSTIPVITCMNLHGDTIWYKEFPALAGSFEKVTYFQDTLYVVGYGAAGTYGQDKASIVMKISTDGKFTDHRSLTDLKLNGITHTNKELWITGENLDYDRRGMLLMKFNGQFANSKGRIFSSGKDRKSEFIGYDMVVDDTILWVGSSCAYTHYEIHEGKSYPLEYETFGITQISHSLDSITTFYPIAPGWGECTEILKDRSGNVWVAGKAGTLSRDSLGLAVACYDPDGKQLLTGFHSLGDHADYVQDMVEEYNGNILIFSSSNNVPEIHIYRKTKFYKKITLTEYADHSIRKVIEYKPGKFIILCLQLAGAFYGKSALIYWTMSE